MNYTFQTLLILGEQGAPQRLKCRCKDLIKYYWRNIFFNPLSDDESLYRGCRTVINTLVNY